MFKRHLSLTAALLALCLLLTACGGGASSSVSTPLPNESAVSVIKPQPGQSTVTPDPGASSVTPDPGASSVIPDPGASSVIPGPGSSSVILPPDEPLPPTEPVTPPEPEYFNPLTGEKIETDLTASRPYAIMLNNLKKALPQCGVAQADIIYEAPAEGGITRMMAVYQSMEGVGTIGTVRSTRPYYLDLALGLDAIFLHAGASTAAYTAIREWGVTGLDCIHGPYEGTLYWRDPVRRAEDGFEHSVLTSGDTISRLVPTYENVRQTHEEGYVLPLTFAENGTPAGGAAADTITVKYSGVKTGVFQYNADSGKYLVEEYGQPYVDGNDGQQVAVTNVLVLFTDISRIPGDTAGRLDVRMTGTGTGYYACGGRFIEINWSKESHSSPFRFTTEDGQDLVLGVGKSYINIVDDSYPVSVN